MKYSAHARHLARILGILFALCAQGGALAAYVLSSEEALIADYMVNDSGQQRASMQLDPILARIARERAQDMAARNYFNHVNPDGLGPNALVREAGYALPGWWGTAAADNYIESIAAGRNTAVATWTDWMNSPSHRTHILATDSFYQNQTSYGVGYAYSAGSTYRHYWVILTAPPNATLGNAALFISQSVPTSMTAGSASAVVVEMLNTGSNTWTQAGGYRLRAGNSVWGLADVSLPGDVAPGGAVTFSFAVVAPGTAGTTNFQWRMQRDGVGPFGESTPLLPISVSNPGPYVAPPSSSSSAYSSSSSSSKKESKKKKKKKKKKTKKKKK
jgi:uncharacterized protein YkwD